MTETTPYPPEWAWTKAREICISLGILTAHNIARISDALYAAWIEGNKHDAA